MGEMKSTDVSVTILSKSDRYAYATFELAQGKRIEFHLRYNGKTAWADALMFEGVTMCEHSIWQFPFSRSAQPLHTLVQETWYLTEQAFQPRWLMDFVRIAMSKTRLPALFRGQVEAELKLVESCLCFWPEVAELQKVFEDSKSFGRTVEMDDAALSEEFATAKSSLDLWSGSAGQRDNRSDNLVLFELEQTFSAARRMLMLHRETARRNSMSAHEKMAFKFERKQLAQP
ncbi:hypothetical protein [Aliiroseovarius lamellibrachiae]|uniref:hypothetical protein n=1 Tax=Aliiroseovarius lamellibrachiae TaxID=1924933 RepID=UPI001BE121E1|nr:hypothetical protein [Aliiroseovarius lamellibrachiae]MBT2132191.1 hypothetical protein [Aliiroseovarius lamellibrachiae]